MSNFSASSTRWNIFARELEIVLRKHGFQMGQLVSQGIVFNSQKIVRLQRSLTSAKHLSTLSPEEMERLITIMQLDDLEQKQLNAALLATAVERILLDRIEPLVALMAANDVFHILFEAMQNQPGTMAGVKGGTMIDDVECVGDAPFMEALDLIDRATLTIHVSRNAGSIAARFARAHEAFDTYTQAQELLQKAQDPPHEHEDWLYWYNEARSGCTSAKLLWQSEGE
jgi:hypothetical protein